MLSIDPSSPFTAGALLGDRIRLSEHFLDEGVYIRSMASRGALGGLSEATLQAVLLMDAAGKEDVLVETVGVGQAEIDIIDHADTIVLVLMPGSGDSVQALKAGVMEIPDVIVVNKADHPLTDTMVREIRGVLALGPQTRLAGADRARPRRPRARGSRSWPQAIDEHHEHIEAEGTLEERRARNLRNEVLGLAAVRMRPRARALAAERPSPRSCSSGSCSASWTRRARRGELLERQAMAEPSRGPRPEHDRLAEAPAGRARRRRASAAQSVGQVAGVYVRRDERRARSGWRQERAASTAAPRSPRPMRVARGRAASGSATRGTWLRDAPRSSPGDAADPRAGAGGAARALRRFRERTAVRRSAARRSSVTREAG